MQRMIDEFGRIVIPKRIRDELGIKPGSVLTIEEHGQQIVMKPVSEHPPLAVKEGVLVFRGERQGELTGAVASHRSERIAKLGRGTRK